MEFAAYFESMPKILLTFLVLFSAIKDLGP